MELDILPCSLKDKINYKREMLNVLIKDGINEELIELSRELDVLINTFQSKQLYQ